jgi:hypothetical protein
VIPKNPFDRAKPTPRGERKPTKHKNPQRSWAAPRDKVDAEGRCRRCHCRQGIEAAHIVPRSRVKPGPAEDQRNIIPLCRHCHQAFDELGLDLSPFLTVEEWEYSVDLVGEVEARRRVTNRREAA